MPVIARKPEAHDLQRVLSDLVQDVVKVTETETVASDGLIAGYQSDDGAYLVTLVSDVNFAAACGGAIGMISPEVVEEIAKEGEVTATVRDNFKEVANILAALLCGDTWAHVRFTDLHLSQEDAPEEMRRVTSNPTRTVSFDVAFERYGVGRASFFLA